MLEVASFELLTQENITLSQRSLRLPRKLRSLSCGGPGIWLLRGSLGRAVLGTWGFMVIGPVIMGSDPGHFFFFLYCLSGTSLILPYFSSIF